MLTIAGLLIVRLIVINRWEFVWFTFSSSVHIPDEARCKSTSYFTLRLFIICCIYSFSLHRRYAKNVSSLGGGIKSRIMGNEDFAMSDLLTSQHDLQYASRNYKFGLIPKVRRVCCCFLMLYFYGDIGVLCHTFDCTVVSISILLFIRIIMLYSYFFYRSTTLYNAFRSLRSCRPRRHTSFWRTTRSTTSFGWLPSPLLSSTLICGLFCDFLHVVSLWECPKQLFQNLVYRPKRTTSNTNTIIQRISNRIYLSSFVSLSTFMIGHTMRLPLCLRSNTPSAWEPATSKWWCRPLTTKSNYDRSVICTYNTVDYIPLWKEYVRKCNIMEPSFQYIFLKNLMLLCT